MAQTLTKKFLYLAEIASRLAAAAIDSVRLEKLAYLESDSEESSELIQSHQDEVAHHGEESD